MEEHNEWNAKENGTVQEFDHAEISVCIIVYDKM